MTSISLNRAIGSFFMEGGWVKMLTTMVARWQKRCPVTKTFKKCWIKHPNIIGRFFSNFRFFSRNSSRISHILQYIFAQKTSLSLQTSAYLTLKIICSHNTARNLSDFRNFPANMFLFGVRKNICTAPFLDAQELHSWILKANV